MSSTGDRSLSPASRAGGERHPLFGKGAVHLPTLLKQLGVSIPPATLANTRRRVVERTAVKRQLVAARRGSVAAARVNTLKHLVAALHERERRYREQSNAHDAHRRDIDLLLAAWRSVGGLLSQLNAGRSPNVSRSAKSSPVRFILECRKPTAAADLTNRVAATLKMTTQEFQDLGGTCSSLFQNFKKDIYFEMILPVPVYEIRGRESGLAHALRKGTDCKRVTPVRPERAKDVKERNERRTVQRWPYGHKTSCCSCFCETHTAGDKPMALDDRPIYQGVPDDTEWHLKQTRVFDAWKLKPSAAGKSMGEGILVGQADTGWRTHREYRENQENLRVSDAFDVFTGRHGNQVAEQPTFPQVIAFYLPTHGIGTGAFLISKKADPARTHVDEVPAGIDQAVTSNAVELTGVAPSASLIPIRCADTPMLINDTNVQKAVEYAIDKRVHVITISLGGVPDRSLEDVIDHAVYNNIIVVASAGQIVDFLSPDNSVVEPGAYTNVIAAAGSNQRGEPWDGSCRGPNVDIVAPAQNVWFANFENVPDGKDKVGYGEGTSFAAPQVAGIAALWLAFWGRDNLLAKYRNKPLSHVFRYIIRKTAWKPSRDWDTSLWGPGIIDAYAVLKERLPDEGDVPDPAEEKASTFSEFSTVVAWFGDRWEDIQDGWSDFLKGAGEVATWIESNETVQFWEDQAANAWAAAEGLAGDAKKFFEDAAATAEQKIEEGVEAGEGALQQLGEQAEQTAEDIGEFAQDAEDTVEGGAEAVVGFFGSLLP